MTLNGKSKGILASTAFCALLGSLVCLIAGSSSRAAPDSPAQDAGRCIYFPLQGAHVINNHAMVLIDRYRTVAMAELSGPCLEGKARLLALRMTSRSETVCSRNDFNSVINDTMKSGQQLGVNGTAMPNMPQMQCSVITFDVIGHLDSGGSLILNDEAQKKVANPS